MAFRGQRVMLSRNFVPREMFDMLRGTLNDNGAEVCLRCNPSYNSSTDFHALPSCESENFSELQSRGCNVVGPECILRCAKERRPLPSARYTCCLSLDRMKILLTGFEDSEKARIHHLVISMCGELCTKASMDIDFVVAKDVLTPKYKWAAFTLRKPILSLNWLVQCYNAHRRVPYEPYRLPIFTGTIMCTTGILLEMRATIAELVVQNGGSLKADLTRECTHLIAKSVDSDKFKVATMHWCHIKCVNEEWFWNSLSEKVCLEESSYAVKTTTMSYGPQVYAATSAPPPMEDKSSQDLEFTVSDPGTGAVVTPIAPEVGVQCPPEGSQAISGEGCLMYLSDCRVYLTGFKSVEMRKLVNMVLDGGGTRHMQFNERITHVVLGRPSESELKDIRQYAMWGAVHVVTPTWLEECSRHRRDVAVSAQFLVLQTLISQDLQSKPGGNKTARLNEEKSVGESLQRKVPVMSKAHPDAGADFMIFQCDDAPQQPYSMLESNSTGYPGQGAAPELEKCTSTALFSPVEQHIFTEQLHVRSHSTLSKASDAQQLWAVLVSNTPSDSSPASLQGPRKEMPDLFCPMEEAGCNAEEMIKPPIASNAASLENSCVPNATTSFSLSDAEAKKEVFEGRVFRFSPSFDACMRAEVVQWVLEGGGRMLGYGSNSELQDAEFLIHPHGPQKDYCTKFSIESVTTQWIKYCLEEGRLLDVNSHILFQPLCCEVPLPGFESFRFAISQYGDRERILLYNLCHALGAKYQEKKMNRRATHLLCKVGDGEKYEAALQWGIEIVTAEWLDACVAQKKIVFPDPYRPKRLTVADKEAGLGLSTQYPAHSNCCDVGVSFVEMGTEQNDPEVSLLATGNHIEGVEVKGKITKNKRKPPLRGRSRSATREVQTRHGSRVSTDCSLSSQMAGSNLDPWDELTASCASKDVKTRPLTRSQQKTVSTFRALSHMLVNFDPSRIQSELYDDLNQSDKSTEGSQATKICMGALVSEKVTNSAALNGLEKEEDESGIDVVSAIEGLLAQTSKVRGVDALSSFDVDQDLLLPDSIRWNSEHDLASLKHPKLMTNRSLGSLTPRSTPHRLVNHRSTERGGEQLVHCVTPSASSVENFEESQMESQVVAYDEDYSEKQRIMERVRTRSMSTSGKSGSGAIGQRKKTSWKGIDFSRLLRAANANK